MNKIDFEELKFEDIEIVRNWRNSKHVSEYMYNNNIICKEAQINWFNKIKKSIDTNYWIIKYDNNKIGLINIININFKNKSCDWAFYIGDNNYIGTGIGFIIEYKFIEKVFYDLNFEVLNCEIISSNKTVINLHKKFGFEENYISLTPIGKNSQIQEVTYLKLTKKKWAINRNKFEKILNKI